MYNITTNYTGFNKMLEKKNGIFVNSGTFKIFGL